MSNSAKITELETYLSELKAERTRILHTGSSWETRDGQSSRSVTNHSLKQINTLIKQTENEIAELTAQDNGYSSKAMRIGVTF